MTRSRTLHIAYLHRHRLAPSSQPRYQTKLEILRWTSREVGGLASCRSSRNPVGTTEQRI